MSVKAKRKTPAIRGRRVTRLSGELQVELEETERLAKAAEAAGAFPAAVTARRQATTIKQSIARAQSEEEASRARSPIEKVRHLRRAATREGSWVAVTALLRQEQELGREIEAARSEEAERDREGQPDEQLIAELRTILSRLPAEQRRQLLEG